MFSRNKKNIYFVHIPKKLDITNTSSRKNSWEDYYTPETKKIVARIYHDDFEFFDYEK